MREKYVSPTVKSKGYHCPHCETYAHQQWYSACYLEDHSIGGVINNLVVGVCQRCGDYTFWIKGSMVYPNLATAPLPNDDMPTDAKADYMEARSIVNFSPRAACALLRLALQKIVIALGEDKELNKAIGSLVKKGLPLEVQKALDCIRVIGNNAVHPAELDLKDDVETANALFGLLNVIVNRMITHIKEVEEIYGKLPPKAIEAIAKRDKVLTT